MKSFRSLPTSSLLVLAFGAFLLLWNLGYAPFWNPDEGRYAAASLEMARGFDGQKPDWIVPHLNTMPRLNKPPLVYWLGATNFNTFGATEWAGRLGSAIFAIGVMILVWSLARRVWGERCGLFAAMIWTTSLFSFGMARVMNTDMLLCGAIALGCYGLWHAVEYVQNARHSASPDIEYLMSGLSWNSSFLLAGVGMGLALLAKGPVGLVFPLLITFVFMLTSARWRVLTNGKTWLGIASALFVAALIAVPWYLAVNARDSQFLKQFLLGENLARFSGNKDFHDPTPFYFYLPTIIGGFLPWTPLLFLALVPARNISPLQRHTTIFLWCWAALVIGLFSLSRTKLISYVLPAFPALAILMAAAAHRVLEARWMQRFAASSLIFVNAILIAACVYLSFDSKRLLDRVLTRETATPFLLFIAAILAVATFVAWRFWCAQKIGRAMMAHFVGAGLFFLVFLSLVGRVAQYEDSSAMVKTLAPRLAPGQKLVQISFQPTAIFYFARPQTFIGFRNTSGLRDDDLRRSELFPLRYPEPEPLHSSPNWKQFQRERAAVASRFLREGHLVLVRRKDLEELAADGHSLLRPTSRIVAQNGDFVILGLRNIPRGFDFNRVPPHKAKRIAAPTSSTR